MSDKQYLYCDLETYSTVTINKGTHRYAEEAEISLFAYALGDEMPRVMDFTRTDFYSSQLCQMLKDEDIITVWHNGGMFDTVVLRKVLGIDIPPHRMVDTMVQAYAHGLPGKLSILGDVFRLSDNKMAEGKKLIHLFCKPTSKGVRNTRLTHPEQWTTFVEYAGRDVSVMRELHKKIPNWNMGLPFEQQLYALDQKINQRGFKVDLELANKMLNLVDLEKERLNARVRELTDDYVGSGTQRDQILKYINVHRNFKITHVLAVKMDNLQVATVNQKLADPRLPQDVRELLTLRKAIASTSTSKYKALLNSVSEDGRLRGTLQFCGASRTGRWAGRIFQPHNLPRPSMSNEDIDAGAKAVKGGYADLLVDDVMQLAVSAIRGCITPSENKKLVVSDLSNIEGRVAAWLAGEDWKLKAFRNFDKGTGPDLYKLSYAHSFKLKPEDVTKEQRQVGKVQELALGYGGGVNAFKTFGEVYDIDLGELADAAYPHIPDRIKAEAKAFWSYMQKEGTNHGLNERVFTTCDSIKRMWRESHPAITSYWAKLNDAAITAVTYKGELYEVGSIKFFAKGAWLRMVLPSGRSVVYCSPKVKDGSLTYYHMHPTSKKWSETYTYGGKLFENACQAVARDVMAANMLRIEDRGYAILLSVHDELITETPDTKEYNAAALSALLATVPAWGEGVPLAASGFETYSYRKD